MAEVETKTSTFNIDLIVEDGRGVPNANSYVSTEYADAFAKNRNYDTWLTQSNYVKRAAVIKAMDYVDNIFNWKGRKKYRDQPLCFPRVDIIDGDGFDRSGEIPEGLKKAVCEAAFYVVDQYTLFGKQDPNGPLAKERKKADVAEIEIERKFFTKDEVQLDYTSAFQALDRFLKGLYWDANDKAVVNHRAVWSN